MTVPDKKAFREGVNSHAVAGDWKPVTIANGEKNSAEVDLDDEYPYIEIKFGTITATNFTIKKTEETGGDMVQIGPDNNLLEVADTGYYTMFNVHMSRFIQFVGSAAQGAERTFYVRGVRP